MAIVLFDKKIKFGEKFFDILLTLNECNNI